MHNASIYFLHVAMITDTWLSLTNIVMIRQQHRKLFLLNTETPPTSSTHLASHSQDLLLPLKWSHYKQFGVLRLLHPLFPSQSEHHQQTIAPLKAARIFQRQQQHGLLLLPAQLVSLHGLTLPTASPLPQRPSSPLKYRIQPQVMPSPAFPSTDLVNELIVVYSRPHQTNLIALKTALLNKSSVILIILRLAVALHTTANMTIARSMLL